MLDTSKIRGYEIIQAPVIILDNRGIPFYDTSEMNVKKFNTPKLLEPLTLKKGKIKELVKPIDQPLCKLPTKERLLKNPKFFNVIFVENPNKCSIAWEQELIIFDYSFQYMPIPYAFFILAHEFGHQYYTTEKFCDLYATNYMLKKGFNKSQIGEGIINTLSERQLQRKNYIIENLLKYAKRIRK